MKKIKLFCVPYAGGSSLMYYKWKPHLHTTIELCSIELAGRGKRYSVPLYTTFEEAVNDIYEIVKNSIQDDIEYALFGHCMGSWIVFELAQKLKEQNMRNPVHIFFSGKESPDTKYNNEFKDTLNDTDFIQKLIDKGVVPKEISENTDLMDVVLRICRADFEIQKNYTYKERNIKFNCAISIFTEKLNTEAKELVGWGKYTDKDCKIYSFYGGHFFISGQHQNVVKMINNILIGEWV